ADAIEDYMQQRGNLFPSAVRSTVDTIAKEGATPLVVVDGARVMGVVRLKDIVKGGIKERFTELRSMGIKTIMITGDNPLTAAAIAAEAGVDDFLAQATPEAKLKLIREYQTGGRLGAMTGDATTDAPARAHAERDPVGGDFQRADYHLPHPAGAARGAVSPHRRRDLVTR